jgi:hypothetical protein
MSADEPPVTLTGTAGDLFTGGDLEVVVWLAFESAADLLAGYNALAETYGWPPCPDPEPERRMLALTWPATVDVIDAEIVNGLDDFFAREGDAEPLAVNWTNAYLLGAELGGQAAALCTRAGARALVKALRVQPAGASFPSTYQYTAEGPAGTGVLG